MRYLFVMGSLATLFLKNGVGFNYSKAELNAELSLNGIKYGIHAFLTFPSTKMR